MKIQQIPDCDVTEPPSTLFAAFCEVESDRAFMAELVDLPTANRTEETLRSRGETTPHVIQQVQEAGRTARIGVGSLGAHLVAEEEAAGSTEYTKKVFEALAHWNLQEAEILAKGFIVRCFHY